MKKPLVQVANERDGAAMLVSLLRKMIREIEAGWKPPFIAVVYPAMDGSLESLSSFSADDIMTARMFSQVLQETKDEFEKQFMIDMLGLDGNALPEAMKQFRKEMDAARERALDRLKKDPEVTDTSAAEAMLKKVFAKDAEQ